MKIKSIVLALVMVSQIFAISVDFYDEQQNNPDITGIRIRINNDSGSPINNAKLRYYFHRTESPYVVEEYYLSNATVSSSNINDNLAYFELSIPSIPVGYYPDMAGFSLALRKDPIRGKTQDYSYQSSSSFVKNTKIVLLSGDDVIFGEMPNVQEKPGSMNVKISGLKFSEHSWLELKNVGKSTAALSDLKLVGSSESEFSLGNDSLVAGGIIRICQSQAACGESSKTLVLPDFDWNDVGEAMLKKDSSMVSYVAWGQAGTHSAAAIGAGLWKNSQDFFPAEERVRLHNADYTKNTYFRLNPQKSGVETNDWFSFTSNDDPAKVVSTPSPIMTFPNEHVVKQIPGENKVLFSWLPVKGVETYRVIVRDQNGSDVYNQTTSKTSVVLPLNLGNYSWTVIGDEEFTTKSRDEYGAEIVDMFNFGVVEAGIDTRIYKQLKIEKIKARRDTRMLNLGYLDEIDKYSWDRPNVEADRLEYHEQNRCWAIAIQVMNHFYGGNLTQDEIVYKGKILDYDFHVAPFLNSGGDMDYETLDPLTGDPTGGSVEAMKWALKVEKLNYTKGAPSYETVKNAIDHNKLVFVGIPKHVMVIYGYVGAADNYAFYYAFVDNEGNLPIARYSRNITFYLIPDVTYGNVQMSDELVHRDFDGDGITDFEEVNRFHTDPNLVDSDNDGIEDKREIYEYTVSAQPLDNPKCGVTHGYDYHVKIDELTRINPIYLAFLGLNDSGDKDCDGKYAEIDPDNDGDGYVDGLVDYHNRFVSTPAIENMDIPGDYTIFGREYVKINDNVRCYNTQTESNSYCNIASADEDIFSYGVSYIPLSIGARAHVGNVDFVSNPIAKAYPNKREKAIARSSAVVHGNVNAFAFSISNDDLKKYDGDLEMILKTHDISECFSRQNGSLIQGSVNLHFFRHWPYGLIFAYSIDMPEILKSKNKIVQNGEIYHLKDRELLNSLTVQAGGTLIIEPGRMFVESLLQIDAGATIRFAEPGRETVLHTNGKIIWNTYNSEPVSNTQYWVSVAKGFKLVHHSSQRFFLDGMWAGTIYAPIASVTMGQVSKAIYGRVLARNVVVHQFAKFYRVDFAPKDAMQVAYGRRGPLVSDLF